MTEHARSIGVEWRQSIQRNAPACLEHPGQTCLTERPAK